MKTRTKGFIVSFILVFAMLIGVFTMMPMTASAAGETEKIIISSVDVDVAEPVVGGKPSYTVNTDSENYTATVEWYEGKNSKTGVLMDENDTFKSGKVYAARIKAVPAEGYWFQVSMENPLATCINDNSAYIDSVGWVEASFYVWMYVDGSGVKYFYDPATAIIEELDLSIAIDGQWLSKSGSAFNKTSGEGWEIKFSVDSNYTRKIDIYLDNFVSDKEITVNTRISNYRAGNVQVTLHVKGDCSIKSFNTNLSGNEEYLNLDGNRGTYIDIERDASLTVDSIDCSVEGTAAYTFFEASGSGKLFVNKFIKSASYYANISISVPFTAEVTDANIDYFFDLYNAGCITIKAPSCFNLPTGTKVVKYLTSKDPVYAVKVRMLKEYSIYGGSLYNKRNGDLFQEGDTIQGNKIFIGSAPTSIKGTVNGSPCNNNGSMDVYANSASSADLSFTWSDLSDIMKEMGYTLTPVFNYTINGVYYKFDFDPSKVVNCGDGKLAYNYTQSFNVYGNVSLELTLYLNAPSGEQYKLMDYTITANIQSETVDSANISVDTPVAGQTPADVKGTLTTEGLTINKETWYEVNGSSLRAMAQDEQFVAGKQYKYEAFVASESGYALASDFYLKINGAFASGNGGLWKTKSAVTARTVLSAEAVNNTLTVEYGGQVRLSVNAKGDGLKYAWKNTGGSAGAPSIGVNGHDNILLTCANAGNFYYTCTVTDKYGNQKVVEFIVKVKDRVQTPKDVYTPARPIPVGTGIEGVEDVNNVFVTKGGSITLKATYKFSDDPNDIYHGGKTPMQGELSYEWVLYILDGSGLKTVVLSTTDTLVIDKNIHETYNTNNICEMSILLSITNTATIGGEELTQSNLNGCTVKVVEGEATGNVGGNISSGQARTYSMRSSGSLEGTIVYLVKDEKVVFATEADANGDYLFTSIPYGSYNVKVDKEGYEEYNKPVEVNAAEVDHDITIILHVCFNNEAGMLWHVPATQPTCSDVTDGTLGNIEYYSCQLCGKFYDAERNLIADSANDPGSLNEMGVPYKAIIYPVHDYCGEAQEGGDADRYLRHRADNCLEETTYWYYCIYCRKSAGDDPSAVDKYYVGNASNQTHSYTLEIADYYYFYQGGETCKDKIWYYHACEYCYEKSPSSVWESGYYGAHAYGTLIPAQGEVHTATELKAGVEAHYFCDVCDTYFDEAYIETTLAMLTGAVPTHSYATEYGYKGADGHANTCSCGAHDTPVAHTPDRTEATATQPIKCTKCQYVIATELGHVHTNLLTKVSAKSASCTADGNIEYYTCSCGKWFTDATATTEITIKDSVVIKAAHNFDNLIPAQDAVHTATELKGAVAAHYHCSCGAYFNERKEATTLEALTGAVPTHTFVEGACECGATDPSYQPPHEHSFVEGKCECGETDPNYTPETNDPGTDVPGTDTPGTDDPNTGNTDEPKDDEGGLGTGAIVAIVVGSVLVVGFALYWFVFKKKRI